jgi:hypothetical protein
MRRRAFAPLRIAVHGVGAYRVVSTVREASECLMDHWPVKHEGAAFEAALQACLDAMEDKATPDAVRQAMIRAAGEAGISVIP